MTDDRDITDDVMEQWKEICEESHTQLEEECEDIKMTDEEIAKEYATEYVMNHAIKAIQEQIPYFNFAEQMFLAGLKAGRPKWHKVADGDLPTEKKFYLVTIKENGLAISYFNGIHWETKYNLGDSGHLVEKVIAWCEIPKYTEE